MKDQILDNELFFEDFKVPQTYRVHAEKWVKICDELQRKSLIGIFIVLGFGLLISYFLGMIVLVGIVFFGVWSFFSLSKRFDALRSLTEHSYVISSSQISDQSPDGNKTILYNEIKNMEVHGYGIDLESKLNKEKITIPVAINDYDRILSLMNHIKSVNLS